MDPLKLYLDTNMILDLFVAQAQALMRGTDVKRPRKFAFLLEHAEKVCIFTSFLVKAEVMRELVAAYGTPPEEVERLWKDFMESLREPVYLSEFTFGEELVTIVARTRLRLRTMFNYQHLLIAKAQDAHFVTGDKDAIGKMRDSNPGQKVLSYIELRQLIADA